MSLKHDEKTLIGTMLIIGAAIALGKLFAGSEQLTWRLAIGRVLIGAATSSVAGVALIQFPDLDDAALFGLASALGIAGAQVIEVMARRWTGTSE